MATKDELLGVLIDGRYRIKKRLGRGGMASAYLATDERFHGRDVVVKIPHGELLDDPTFKRRFIQEAQRLIELEYPHVVSVHDGGEDDDRPFLVMQYLSGGSLSDRMEAAGGALSAEEVVEWLPQVASALDRIHETGVLHRDIKPGNLLFDERGNPYIADFGIAKVLDETDATVTMTATGGVVGTPAYIAPEGALGERIGAASDQYSLAAMVYHVLAGRLPHEVTGLGAMLMAKATKDPKDLAEVVPDMPKEAAGVVMRALGRDPELRFSSCESFAAEFVRHVVGEPASGAAEDTEEEEPGEALPPTVVVGGAADIPSDEPKATDGPEPTEEPQDKPEPAPEVKAADEAEEAREPAEARGPEPRDEAEGPEEPDGAEEERRAEGEGPERPVDTQERQDEERAEPAGPDPAPPGETPSREAEAPPTDERTEPTGRADAPRRPGRRRASSRRPRRDTPPRRPSRPSRSRTSATRTTHVRARTKGGGRSRGGRRWLVTGLLLAVALGAGWWWTTTSGAGAGTVLGSLAGDRASGSGDDGDGRVATLREEIPAALEAERLDEASSLIEELATLAPSTTGLPGWRDRLEALSSSRWEDPRAGVRFVQVPGASFAMGCTQGDDDCEPREFPRHQVQVPGFWIAQTETTNRQYDACVQAGGCDPLPSPGDPDRPVVGVTWDEASAFCEWLGGRLPSEAEWEYAARGGRNDWRYPWGDGIGAMNLLGQVWREPAEVATTRDKNGHGLYDMAGNVWEWVADLWHPDYEGAPTDGSAWTSGSGSLRVARGGSGGISPSYLRVSSRDRYRRDFRGDFVGFRCARTQTP